MPWAPSRQTADARRRALP